MDQRTKDSRRESELQEQLCRANSQHCHRANLSFQVLVLTFTTASTW